MNQYAVAAICAAISFAAAVILYLIFIPVLRKVKLGQKILDVGPEWHKCKEGTPIMGGAFFIIPTFAAFLTGVLVIKGEAIQPLTLINMCMLLANALIGFIDDYVKLFKKTNKGLSAWQKLLLQIIVASAYITARAYFTGVETALRFPFTPWTLELGAAYYPLAIIAIVYIINCANLTDGIDGLAGSTATVITVACLLMSGAASQLGLFESSLIGGLAAFLIFNFHPAKIFMGDCGSLFLGASLVASVACLGCSWLIFIAGAIYVLEGLSVIIQVTSYKLTKKRVFKMSPIHHHFEMCGWSEVKIVGVFSFFTALMCALTYWLYAGMTF